MDLVSEYSPVAVWGPKIFVWRNEGWKSLSSRYQTT